MYLERENEIFQSLGVEYGRYLVERNKQPSRNAAEGVFNTNVKTAGLFDSFDDNGLIYLLTQFVTLYDASKKSGQDAGAAAEERTQANNDSILGAFSLREVTEALEREDALLSHLNLHASYYRAMLWNVLPPMEQQQYLRALLPLGIVEPHLAGFLGDKLAFPIRLDASPEAQALIDQLIVQNAAVAGLGRVETVRLPTAAVTIESRLGECDGCEEYIRKQRDLELKARKLQNELAEKEVARYQARLDENPKVLDDPDQTAASVRVILETPSPPKT